MNDKTRMITVLQRLALMTICLGLLAYLAVAASKSWQGAELGDLSQYYETGDSADPGYISTVTGDSGGTSYGIYMFASNAGTPYNFAQWLYTDCPSPYSDWGAELIQAYNYSSSGAYAPGYGSNFNAAWKRIANTYPSEFTMAQKQYWYVTYYSKLVSNITGSFSGFDLDNYGIALKNVFWSRSVQHGTSGATNVITRAFNTLGGFKNQSEAELISAIYAESSKLDGTAASNVMRGDTANKYGVNGRSMAYYSANSGAVQISVYRRLHVNEPSDALVMRYANFGGLLPEGAYLLLDYTNQARALTNASSVTLSPVDNTSTAQKITFTYYESGFYTLSMNGKRLSDQKGTPTFADPSTAKEQFWAIALTTNGYTLQNRGTGRYLVSQDGGITLSSNAGSWQISAQSDIQGIGMFYPGSENGITHSLTAGSSSFPVRGIVRSSVPLTNVTVKVSGKNGGFTASSGSVSTYAYDLWDLDDKCTFSRLSAGDYTLTIAATNRNGTETLCSSTFTVGVSTGASDDETYVVTFDARGGTCTLSGRVITSVTYTLGEVYGDLPVARKDGYNFVGWFLADGTEITPNSAVAAENHTLYAKYGDLYTVTFLNADGSTLKTLKLAEGELIIAPTSPVKASDAGGTYSFSYWQDASGNKYVAGKTYMSTANVTYTPVFVKNSSATDRGYLSGVSVGTTVSAFNQSGYTVYNAAGTQITGGTVATGMTAVYGPYRATIVVLGDINGDGALRMSDLLEVQSHILGDTTLTGASAKAADFNGDGAIKMSDLLELLSAIMEA